MRTPALPAVALSALLAIACDRGDAKDPGPPRVRALIRLSSPAFAAGAAIPRKYTCDGDDVSPPLSWDGTPAGTRSLALVVEDPDARAGVFTHWVLFNIPPDRTRLDEAIPRDGAVTDGAPRQGMNDFGKVGYGGPCPPRGTHRYVFRLYALDSLLDQPPKATKARVLAAMEGHVLARGELVGTYKR